MRLPRLITAVSLALAIAACGTVPSTSGSTSPENIAWRLDELSGSPARSAGGENPTLQLDSAQGRARGNAGCNMFSGPYQLRGDSLTFGALVSTRRACVDEAMNRQEVAYTSALAAARTWTLSGDTLLIRGPEGSARF